MSINKELVNDLSKAQERIAELEAENAKLWSEQHEAQRVYRRLLAERGRYKQVLEQIAEEEETLGWVYAARMAKNVLEELG